MWEARSHRKPRHRLCLRVTVWLCFFLLKHASPALPQSPDPQQQRRVGNENAVDTCICCFINLWHAFIPKRCSVACADTCLIGFGRAALGFIFPVGAVRMGRFEWGSRTLVGTKSGPNKRGGGLGWLTNGLCGGSLVVIRPRLDPTDRKGFSLPSLFTVPACSS